VAEDSDFTLRVTDGSVVPDRVLIVIGTESYFFGRRCLVYRFIKCGEHFFSSEGNGVESKQYNLEVRAVPTIKEFEMQWISLHFL
jgi:hypothetical protein